MKVKTHTKKKKRDEKVLDHKEYKESEELS
jgi:hypothetical protein